MIIANFSKGETSKEIYSGLWQWDYGQVLRIQGLELPTATEIHFSLRDKGGEAVTRVGTTKDGVTDVVIPDAMLENNGSAVDYFIYAFVYITDETSGQTEYKISMKVKSRPKPEAYDSPEDAELFREAIATVNDAADRAETAEREAEGWAHGREDMPEKAEDNAKYYAGEAAKDAEQTSADRKEVERLVESVSGIDEDVELVRGYKEAAEKAAEGAATSAQVSEESRKSSETAKRAAETAQAKAEEAAGKTAEDREAVERAKTDVEGMKSQVTEHKTSIEQTVSDFGLTAQQVVMAVNNAGQTQTERVQGAGNTAVQDIQTAKEQAVQNVETAGTQQVQAVQTEGTTQIGAVQQKGQEVLDSIPEDFSTQMDAKLDKNQGAENSGKILVVGEDGTVTPGETPIKVDSTLTQSGQAADAKATGDTITDLAIKNQESGAVPIIITDSAEYPIQDLEMEGWTEQQSTTGAQLYDQSLAQDNLYQNYDRSSLVFTISKNSSYWISGKIPVVPNTTYSINKSISGGAFYSDKDTPITTEIIANKTFTTPDNCNYIVVNFIKSIVPFGTLIMLNSGSTSFPWEPYTGGQPSPSPEYPQEIVNAGSWNEDRQKWEYEIEISGANLFDIDDNEPDPISPTILRFKCHLKEGMTYILSTNGTIPITFKISNTRDGYNSVSRYNVTEPQTFVMTRNEHISETNEQFIFMWIQNNNVEVNDISMIKGLDIAITPGSAALPYEPYKEPQTVLLQSDRPLTKWDRLEKRDGQWGWVYKSLIVEFDGSDDEDWIRSNQPTIRPDLYLLKSKIYENVKLQGESYVDAYTKSDNGQMEQDKRFHDRNSYFGEGRLAIRHDEYSDIAEWKTHLSEHPITWVVKTETETFVPLTESEQSALNALHTNYPTTVLNNDQECKMSLEYVADTKNYIDQKIQESIQQSIAGNLLSTNSNQSLSAPMGAALNLRLEALEAKIE